MAFYPTKIPLHHRSKFLGDRDPFGDLVNGCRKLGMYVVARTDAAHQELYELLGAAHRHHRHVRACADGLFVLIIKEYDPDEHSPRRGGPAPAVPG
jgi:hypothetical protein